MGNFFKVRTAPEWTSILPKAPRPPSDFFTSDYCKACNTLVHRPCSRSCYVLGPEVDDLDDRPADAGVDSFAGIDDGLLEPADKKPDIFHINGM